jgi:hypothetical protein
MQLRNCIVVAEKVSNSLPDAASHIFAVLSPQTVAIRFPSGLKVTSKTELAWPDNVNTSF